MTGVELVATSKLEPNKNNSRTHSDEQVKQISVSIIEFGFTNPILIDENNGIMAGHGRLLAAKLLNIDKVPCIKLSNLSETQKKAYIIADNQLALNAGWDLDLLKLEIDDLSKLDFDISLLGFDDDFFSVNNKETTPDNYDYVQVFNIVIEANDEQHQQSIYNKLTKEGFKCQVQSL